MSAEPRILSDVELANLRKVMEEGVFAYYPRFLPLLDSHALLAERVSTLEGALSAIVEVPYGVFGTKGGYAYFVRDLARNSLAGLGADPATQETGRE